MSNTISNSSSTNPDLGCCGWDIYLTGSIKVKFGIQYEMQKGASHLCSPPLEIGVLRQEAGGRRQ
ncbi:hypothetical protein, partial [Microcoleus sp. S13_D1]|uniref:hypothetical protein n=1 Tax=Microcoleus sp. S13_D1 TaxID=3055412 RepID=UPI002FD374CF